MLHIDELVVLNVEERACRHGSALSDSRRTERPQPHATLLELPHESFLQFTDAEPASRRQSHSCTGSDSPREWIGDVGRSTVADAGRGFTRRPALRPPGLLAGSLQTIGSKQKSLQASSWLPEWTRSGRLAAGAGTTGRS